MKNIPHWKNKTLSTLKEFIKGVGWVIEEWRDIPEYESFFMISSFGRIKSMDRTVERSRNGVIHMLPLKGKIISQFLDGGGYPGVKITKNGVVKWFHTHRMVGLIFIKNPGRLPEINHLYGDKWDNVYLNLEWSTKSDNLKHAFRTGLKKSKFSKFGKGNPKSKPVDQFSKLGIYIKTFAGQQEASRETGVDQSMIWHVCNGKRKTGGGYIWKYAKGYRLGKRGAIVKTKT